MPIQLRGGMQWIGFSVAGASPVGPQVFDRVIRHVGSGDFFSGSSCAVQEVQRDRQAILKQFLRIVGTDSRNTVCNCISEPGLDFPEKRVFWGGIHQNGFLSRRVDTQTAPAGDLRGRGCLIGECESPGRAVVRPQSRKWKSRA